jgi:hypothetical protein
LIKVTVHCFPFQPASQNRPTASFSTPPGLAARKPTGGLPKQPARAARLGQIVSQQPPVATANLSRPMPPAWIRRRPLPFGDIKNAKTAAPWKTLDVSFSFPCPAASVCSRPPPADDVRPAAVPCRRRRPEQRRHGPKAGGVLPLFSSSPLFP